MLPGVINDRVRRILFKSCNILSRERELGTFHVSRIQPCVSSLCHINIMRGWEESWTPNMTMTRRWRNIFPADTGGAFATHLRSRCCRCFRRDLLMSLHEVYFLPQFPIRCRSIISVDRLQEEGWPPPPPVACYCNRHPSSVATFF